MTIAFVQANNNGNAGSSATTRAVTLGAAVGANGFVYGVVTWGSGTTTDLTSITDDKSNTNYVILDKTADSTNGQSAAQFYGWNLTGGPTVITANFGSSQIYTGISVLEFSGVQSSSDPLDGTNHQAQVVATPGTGTDGLKSGAGTQTPSVAGCLVAGGGVDTGAVNASGSSEFAAGTNFTEPANAEHQVGSDISLSSEYWIQTSATAANASWTVTQNVAHIAFQAVFKPSGAAAPADNPRNYQDGTPASYYTDPGYAAIYVPQQLGITVAARSTSAAVVTSADGSITTVNTTTGVGAATQNADASVTVVTTLTGVGAASVKADAFSTDVLTLTGVGQASVRADGSITLTSTLTGIGASTQKADASDTNTFTLTGVGASSQSAAASDTNTLTLTGVGAATAQAVASDTNVFTLNGEGASVAAGSANGNISIVSTLTGVGASSVKADASASGVLTLSGVGASQAPTIAAADGGIVIAGGLSGVGASSAKSDGSIVITGGLTGNTQLTARRRADGRKPKKALDVDADDAEILELAALVLPLLGSQAWAH